MSPAELGGLLIATFLVNGVVLLRVGVHRRALWVWRAGLAVIWLAIGIYLRSEAIIVVTGIGTLFCARTAYRPARSLSVVLDLAFGALFLVLGLRYHDWFLLAGAIAVLGLSVARRVLPQRPGSG